MEIKKKGLYCWKKSDDSLQAFVGNFKDNKIEAGLYFSQSDKNLYSIYVGKFIESEGKTIKSDENAFYYDSDIKKIYLGKVEGDKLLQGTFITLN